MKRVALVIVALSLSLSALPAFAARHCSQHNAPPAASAPQASQSVTHGSVTVDGRRINYKAISGIAIIKNNKGQPYTSMSYFAYIRNGGNETDRPITFFYNGGPG
ncbi:MAG: peptidase S10, partial [Gammaproteobacteria bacterium]